MNDLRYNAGPTARCDYTECGLVVGHDGPHKSAIDLRAGLAATRSAEADLMCRAAQEMRTLANAVDALGSLTDHIAVADCDEFADFIAAWDPVVARAVADVLDEAATNAEGVEAVYRAHLGGRERPKWAKRTPALVLAETYLGISSPPGQAATS